MKYKLYEELLRREDILSHVFLSCIDKRTVERTKIENENNNVTEEQRMSREIDITLLIDGYECDPRKFFDNLYSQYRRMVEEKATEIVKEQTSDAMRELTGKLDEMSKVLDRWSETIDWDVPNPFNKEKENE